MSGIDVTATLDLIPVTVLTGFLGSGKTTVLNRLLRQPGLDRTIAIINEFGEVGIDHLLIETSEERLELLDNGCICCTVRGDLAETLKRLCHAPGGGRIAAIRSDPDRALEALRAIGVKVIHEPRAGVANARNTGLKSCARRIHRLPRRRRDSFGKLARRAAARAARHNADAVFGPVHTKLAGVRATTTKTSRPSSRVILLMPRPDQHLLRLRLQPRAPRCAALGRAPSRRSATRSAEKTISCSRPYRPMARPSPGRLGAWCSRRQTRPRHPLAYTLKRAFAYGQGPADQGLVGQAEGHPRHRVLDGRRRRPANGGVRSQPPSALFLGKTQRRAFAYRRIHRRRRQAALVPR